MKEIDDNEKLLEFEICDRICTIIDSRNVEYYKHLVSIIILTIEAIAEQYENMAASDLATYICTLVEHDEQKGGDN